MKNLMKLLIATKNIGKFNEIKEVLGDLDLELFHLHMEEFSKQISNDHFEENGETFEENAEMKAIHYNELTGLATIGEDSGIIVDALKGELGVKTRRWGAGEDASDEDWIKHFMEVMKNVPEEKRTARFICTAAFKDHGGEVVLFRGQTEGIITHELQAPLKPGIPLSSCFIPVGNDKVYAALSEEEKNQVSHRGKAFHDLKHFLITEFNL